MDPSSDDVRVQLERILASDGFANAERMSRFLRYVVDRVLAGQGDQIKEYVVGVEVFGRQAEYDPRVDSIVRVEARRLRTKLDEYYSGPGRDDPVVIELRRGTYVPQFHCRAAATVAPAMTPSASNAGAALQAGRPTLRRRSIALGAASVAVLIVVLFASRGLWTDAATSTPAVSVIVLPLVEYSSNHQDAAFAANLTDGLTSQLARTGTLSVVSHTTALQFASGERRDIRTIASALHVDVVVEGRVSRTDDRVNVDVRLVNAATDRKFWVRQFSGRIQDSTALEREIAATIAPVALAVRPAR
jgi:TolB-like protein